MKWQTLFWALMVMALSSTQVNAKPPEALIRKWLEAKGYSVKFDCIRALLSEPETGVAKVLLTEWGIQERTLSLLGNPPPGDTVAGADFDSRGFFGKGITQKGWRLFRAAYPKAHGFVRVSDVVLDDNGRYYAYFMFYSHRVDGFSAIVELTSIKNQWKVVRQFRILQYRPSQT